MTRYLLFFLNKELKKEVDLMKVEERLIVAADYSPKQFGGIEGVKKKVLSLAQELEGLGVYIKVNSVLRAVGYGLINELHDMGLKVFADLKLIDIPFTMGIDGQMLNEVKPEILTVMCCAGIDGMNTACKALPDTEILGVTVLTSLNEEECSAIFSCSSKAGVLKFARMAQLAGLGGIILSPMELAILNQRFELVLSLNTPGIRFGDDEIKNDDQARKLPPGVAIKNGAQRLVVGRLITGAKPNNKGLPQNPREAAERMLKEIREGLGRRVC